LKVGLNGAVAYGSLSVGRDGHIPAEAGIVAEENETGLTQGNVAPLAIEAEGNFAERGCAAKRAFKLNGAGVGDVRVGAGGVTLQAKPPLLRVREPESEVGVGEGEGSFLVIELEVETRAGSFDVGKARSEAGSFLGGGGGIDVGRVKEDAFEVPFPFRGVDEIDAGLVGEADVGKLDAAAPEGADAEGYANGAGANDGLGAEGGILVDDEVFKREAGEREEIQTDFVEVNGAAQAGADAVRDALLITVDADERRKQDKQKNNQSREGHIEKAAKGVGAERGWNVGINGFAILVGWIHFLH
jgi:hypothetical protein